MIDYRFLSPAENEMTEASAFYEWAASGLGAEFLNEVQSVIDLIRRHPELGARVESKFRRVLLHRFPFNLIYSTEVEEILIIAVAHQRRRPDYWRERL